MLHLRTALTKNPRFEPLIDGRAKSSEVTFDVTVATPPELFYRNLKYDEFDLFEMSLSEYLITRERRGSDRWQWIALPIFPAKAFVWLGLFVNTAANIKSLADFRGKRVGVPDYVMTAALWLRVFLRELYGIQPQEISWHIGRIKEFSHGALLGLDKEPPAGVSITWLSDSQTFDVMLDRGEIDAAYGFAPRHDRKLQQYDIDRYGGIPIEGNPRLRKLFPDAGREVVAAFYRKTQVVPANHVLVVQRKILAENLWLALELVKLFSESKRIAYGAAECRSIGYLYFEGDDPQSQAATFGNEPFPYGVSANRKMLEMLAASSHHEGLTRQMAQIDKLFAAATLES
jgi:4,5-dihydroxyphthalate decarboxylase